MIIERSLNERFLSNTYLVADGEGGAGFFVDAGGPVTPLVEAAKRLGIEPTHILLTHHHFDHVCDVGTLRKRWPKLKVLIHPLEREPLAEMGEVLGKDVELESMEAGEVLRFGGLEVRPLRTPGHTAGMLSLLVSESAAHTASHESGRSGTGAGPGGFQGGEAVVFTGDTLFKGSVGGVRAPGHTTYTDLRDSIMGTLMELPGETIVYPGHTDATSVAREWEQNSFIRVWRGLDPEGSEPCVALGEPATLVLLGEDYDGGKKAWVRWPDGKDDIVPGSRVESST
ncbi:MAG TPA: MBL fold metallo-hydrolase [Solirubrobacteraceae bacterium]|jgi:hydroxyacylglutathione hydrolase|nr:MBL fold metallo-hydrolase [Solirubrobacteraceae bacterium]